MNEWIYLPSAGSLPKNATTTLAGPGQGQMPETLSRCPIWVAGAQVITGLFSTAFAGTLAGSWIGCETARTLISILITDAGIASSRLPSYATMLAPSCKFLNWNMWVLQLFSYFSGLFWLFGLPVIWNGFEDKVKILVGTALTLQIALRSIAIWTILSLAVKTVFFHLLGLYFFIMFYSF